MTPADPEFAWLADIIIPAFTGLASVALAIAALVATGRAGKLARDAEAHRAEAEEHTRIAEERRHNLEKAQAEARTVARWVDLAYQATAAALSNRNLRVELRYQASAEAKATLEHSFFPGARDLLELTSIDARNVTATLQSVGKTLSIVEDLTPREHYHRQRRSLERVRRWGLDPDGEADNIHQELQYARDNLPEYLAAALPPRS